MIAIERRDLPRTTRDWGRLFSPVREIAALPALLRDAAALAFAPTRANVVHWVSWSITLSIVLATTLALWEGRVFGWEQDVTRWVQQRDYPQWLFDVTSNRITGHWEGAFIVLVAGLGLLALRQRIDAGLVLLTFPLHVLGNFPKALVDRQRPSDLYEGIFGVGGGTSFASGHSEFAFTFFGFLAYVALIHVRSWPGRVAIVLAWLVFAAPVGYDRIATGNHWPLDILIGYIAGVGLLSGLIWLRRALVSATGRSSGEASPRGEDATDSHQSVALPHAPL